MIKSIFKKQILDGSCPPLSVEDYRFSDVLDRPLDITGTCQTYKTDFALLLNQLELNLTVVTSAGFDLTEKFLDRKGTVLEDMPSFRLGSAPLIKPTK